MPFYLFVGPEDRFPKQTILQPFLLFYLFGRQQPRRLGTSHNEGNLFPQFFSRIAQSNFQRSLGRHIFGFLRVRLQKSNLSC